MNIKLHNLAVKRNINFCVFFNSMIRQQAILFKYLNYEESDLASENLILH